MLAASNPRLTPWYLGAVSIGVMNMLIGLELATLKKEEIEAQCRGSGLDAQLEPAEGWN